MPGEITKKQIEDMRKEFSSDSSAKVAQNAVTSNNLSTVALRRDLVQEVDFTFSTKLDEWKATNQKVVDGAGYLLP